MKKQAYTLEKVMRVLFTAFGFTAVIMVAFITVYLIFAGLPAIKEIGFSNFVLGKDWLPADVEAKFGILPFILTSVYGTVGAVILGVPIGVMCAVYVAKTAPRFISRIFSTVVDILAGIPSVVYGLVGMTVLVPAVKNIFNLPDGANLLSAILILTVMILPSVINVSVNALKTVPKEYEEASYALGANKTETIFKVIVPAAKSGISAAVVLGVGRAIGEAMAVIMVAGNVANMPRLFKSVKFLTTAIVSEMSYSVGLQRRALFSIALILFLFVFIINVFLTLVIKRKRVIK